jgi:hypothetical protein
MPHDGDNFYSFDDIVFSGGSVSYPKNTFAGMKIYGVSLNHTPGEITKVVVRCVEDGTIPKTTFPAAINSLAVNVSDRYYEVSIAGTILPQLFLQKIEKNTAVSQKTLTLTFVDASILLDKIYVGLINQHASNNDAEIFDTTPTNYALLSSVYSSLRQNSSNFSVGGWTAAAPAGPTDPLPSRGIPIRSRLVNFDIALNCEPCYDQVVNSLNGLAGAGRFPSFRTAVYGALRVVDYGRIVDVDHRYGGKIILGQEQFTESNGDLANVDYNFSELLLAIKEAGIDWAGFVDINPAYRKDYTGTLREVLDAWAADFGFMHFWDFLKSSSDIAALKCIYLTSATSSATVAMNSVKAIVFNPVDGLGFDNVNESLDMSATKTTNFQVYYKKPARPKSFQRRIQYRQVYQVMDPYEIFPASINGGRNRTQFDISCALAKFNKNARTIYNFYFTNAVANKDTNHLGIRILEEISGPEMQEMLNEDFSCQQWEQIFDRYATDAVSLAACKGYVAVYSRQEESKWESWEARVADMYGKYYIHEEQNDYMNFCGVTEKWELETQHEPQGIKIKGNDFGDLPFNSLIRSHPKGRSILSKAYGSFSNNYFNVTNQADRMFTVFQRNAPWGTDASEFESAFVHSGVDFLEKLVPTYIPLNGKSKLRFFDRIKDTLASQVQAARIEGKVSSAGRDAQVVLMLAPPANFLGNNFIISNWSKPPHLYDTISTASNVPPAISTYGGWVNPNEYKDKDDRAKLAPCSETYYEKDIKKDGCKCPTLYGWAVSGADVSPSNPYGVVPIVTQDEEVTLGQGLAPRPGVHMATSEAAGNARGWYMGNPHIYPWADWGARNWSIAGTTAWSNAQADLMKPFLRNERQEELKSQYGTIDWPLSDAARWVNGVYQPPSVESRYQLHLSAGFRIKSYAPGYSAVTRSLSGPTYANPNNSNPFSTAPVGANTTQSFYDPTGSGFMGPQVTVDIIYPSQNWYEGVKHTQASYTKTERGQKQVRGRIMNAGYSQAIDVNSMDITSDLESLSNPEGDTIVQVPIPNGSASSSAFGFSQVGIDDYYNSMRNAVDSITIQLPRETLSFRQIGADPALSAYLNPAAGLDGFNIVLDQDGAYIDWSFSTRPSELPKPDVWSRKVGPSMNMNVIR